MEIAVVGFHSRNLYGTRWRAGGWKDERMDDLFSVVIPAYNASKFIASAVQSVFDQTYRNVEVVVVDDGSVDDTSTKLLSYGDRIRVVTHEKNMGVAASRNSGVRNCRGSLVAFLDGDDIWVPEKLEVFAESFSRNREVLFAFSDFSRFEWSDRKFFALTNSQISPNIFKFIEYKKYSGRKIFVIPKEEMFTLLLEGYPIAPSTMVVRKRIFDTIGTWRDELRTNEDFDFSLRSSRATDFIYIDEPLTQIGRFNAGLSANILRHSEGDMQVFDLHLADTSYSGKERDLIKYYKGRRLCGLGYSHIRAGNRNLALKRYIQALRYGNWFWHALVRIAYLAIGGTSRNRTSHAKHR